jgi:hypothetical protein
MPETATLSFVDNIITANRMATLPRPVVGVTNESTPALLHCVGFCRPISFSIIEQINFLGHLIRERLI